MSPTPNCQLLHTQLNEHLAAIVIRLDAISVTLAKQAKDIEYHIARTDRLEELLAEHRAEVAPLKMHVAVSAGIAKVVAGLGALTGLVLGAVQIWRTLRP